MIDKVRMITDIPEDFWNTLREDYGIKSLPVDRLAGAVKIYNEFSYDPALQRFMMACLVQWDGSEHPRFVKEA